MKNKIYSVYVIRQQGTIKYVGITSNFERRSYEHLNRIGTTFSAIPPDVLLSDINIEKLFDFNTKSDALKKEDEVIVNYNLLQDGWNQVRSGYIVQEEDYDKQKTYRWRNTHREYWKNYINNWRDSNPDKVKEQKKKDYEKHKDERREMMKRYRESHKEELKIKKHEYYLRTKLQKQKSYETE